MIKNLSVKLGCILLAAVPLCLFGWVWLYAFSPGPQIDRSEISVLISPDIGFREIEQILVREKVIYKDLRFALLARLMGAAHHLRAGEYFFESQVVPYQVLTDLVAGSVVRRAVIIPEGLSTFKIAEILAAGGWVDKDKFLSLTRDLEFIRELGLNVKSLEGYLFPDTYYLEIGGQTEEEIISLMAARMQEVLFDLGVAGSSSDLDIHRLLTLASIVEKETAMPRERPLIARVFLNRLAKNMRLQADPTVIYGLAKFDGNITRKDLRTPTPYNTYIIKGLPPGPIGNPGRASIEAVLDPAQESYYYFVSRNDGSHYFSKSLNEHNRAVFRYQQNGKK